MVSRPLQSQYQSLKRGGGENDPIPWNDKPEIGDVDEGIVERGEDTGNTKNELACTRLLESSMHKIRITSNIPSPARGPRETFSLAAVVVFLGGILGVLVVGWNMEQEKK